MPIFRHGVVIRINWNKLHASKLNARDAKANTSKWSASLFIWAFGRCSDLFGASIRSVISIHRPNKRWSCLEMLMVAARSLCSLPTQTLCRGLATTNAGLCGVPPENRIVIIQVKWCSSFIPICRWRATSDELHGARSALALSVKQAHLAKETTKSSVEAERQIESICRPAQWYTCLASNRKKFERPCIVHQTECTNALHNCTWVESMEREIEH